MSERNNVEEDDIDVEVVVVEEAAPKRGRRPSKFGSAATKVERTKKAYDKAQKALDDADIGKLEAEVERTKLAYEEAVVAFQEQLDSLGVS